MALDCIDERRDKEDAHATAYRDRLARSYNQKVIPRSFEVGDLVLSIAPHVPRNESAGKFAPNWEGPYRIRETAESGYYKLERLDGSKIKGKPNDKVNGMWLKTFYM
ncbi:hypothetical protein MKX03_018158 [Papaver bracteatum]|nr:hypothetical protein MKX03_018158 [Papaver bracteatum]